MGYILLCCHANPFPPICDYRQTRSPLEKGATKGRDRRKRQLSNFFVADMGDCSKYRILQMAVIRDDDYLTWAFIPLRRIVPLRGTLSCAFGAALLQGPTRRGLSHMGFHAACRIVSCSVVMLTRFPTICDHRQTRSPLEKGAAKGRDRRKRQLSNFCVAREGNCRKIGILQMAVM